MRRVTKVGFVFAVMALLVVGAYAYTEYRFAQKPTSLATIPEYAYGEPSYPVKDLTSQERTNPEQALRRAAATAVVGYHIADERFMATKTPKNDFIGDALRNEVNGYLNRNSSYNVVAADNSTPENNNIFYRAWQHNNPQRLFNSNVIVAAALMTPVRTGPNDEQIHIYGYFRLDRN
jgi:hypothetical protein